MDTYLYDDQLEIVVVSDAEKFVWSLVSLMKTSHHVSLFASSTKNKMSKTNSSIHLQRTEQSFHGGLLLPLLLAVLLQNHEYKRLYFLLYFYLYRGIWRSVNTFKGLLNSYFNWASPKYEIELIYMVNWFIREPVKTLENAFLFNRDI